jgi:hypothetical protein
MDEDLFRLFVHYCYVQKYGKGCRNKRSRKQRDADDDLTYGELAAHRPDMPSRNAIRTWARRIQWNLLYYKETPRGLHVDPYETHLGQTYYGYLPDQTLSVAVCARQKPVDEVFSQHFYANKRRSNGAAAPSAERKRQLVDKFDDK